MNTATQEPKTKIPFVQAERMAELILPILSPFCETIQLVGSLRRRKETNSTEPVGDIEFLAIPKILPGEPIATLFGEELTEPIDLLHSYLTNQAGEEEEWFPRLNLQGHISSMGPSIKHLRFHRPGLDPIRVDVFTATPEQWGVLSIIRTGPAEFNKYLVTQKRFRGLCPDDLWFKDWRLSDANGVPVHETPTEESVFAAIRVPYLDIAARERIAKEHTNS